MELQSSTSKNKTEKSKLSSALQIIISIIIVVLCVYFAIKDIDFKVLWEIIKNANYIWVFLSIPVIVLSHWVRALRWRRILKPIKYVKSIYPLFASVMIGYALNAITPRGGEFVRPLSFSRREKVSYSSTFATIVVERVIDLITLALLFILVMLFFNNTITNLISFELDPNKLILYSILFLVLIIFAFYPPVIKFLLAKIVKPISLKLFDRLTDLFNKFTVGLSIIKAPSEYFMLIIESITIWILYCLPMYFMFFSFNFHNIANLGFPDAILLLVVSGIATTFAPTPGALGVYHLAIQTAMVVIYKITPEDALAYATLTHAINYLIQLGLGGWYFLKENSFKKSSLYLKPQPDDNNT